MSNNNTDNTTSNTTSNTTDNITGQPINSMTVVPINTGTFTCCGIEYNFSDLSEGIFDYYYDRSRSISVEAQMRGDPDNISNSLPALGIHHCLSEVMSNPIRESVGASIIVSTSKANSNEKQITLAHNGKSFDSIDDMIQCCLFPSTLQNRNYGPNDTSMFNRGIKDITLLTNETVHFSLRSDGVLMILIINNRLRLRENKMAVRGGIKYGMVNFSPQYNPELIKNVELQRYVKEFYEMTKNPYCSRANVYHKYDFMLDRVVASHNHGLFTKCFLEYKFRNQRQRIYYNGQQIEYKSIRTDYSIPDTFEIYSYHGHFYVKFFSHHFRYTHIHVANGKKCNGLARKSQSICVDMNDRSNYFLEKDHKNKYKIIIDPQNLISTINITSYFSRPVQANGSLRQRFIEKLDFVEHGNNISLSIGSDNIYNFTVNDIDRGNSDHSKYQMTEIIFDYNGPDDDKIKQLYRQFLRTFICNRNKNVPTTNITFRFMVLNTRKRHFKLAEKKFPECTKREKKPQKIKDTTRVNRDMPVPQLPPAPTEKPMPKSIRIPKRKRIVVRTSPGTTEKDSPDEESLETTKEVPEENTDLNGDLNEDLGEDLDEDNPMDKGVSVRAHTRSHPNTNNTVSSKSIDKPPQKRNRNSEDKQSLSPKSTTVRKHTNDKVVFQEELSELQTNINQEIMKIGRRIQSINDRYRLHISVKKSLEFPQIKFKLKSE
jgi:hypothetical protein